MMATNQNVTLKAYRYDPDVGQEPRYDSYQVPIDETTTVLEALYYILERVDGSLSFRSSCRSAVCGSCAMFINGMNRLACRTQIVALNSREVRIAPLPHLPVIKDLVVDMAGFWEKYERVRPYLITTVASPDKEWPQSEEERKAIEEAIDCILCACCHSSCTMSWWDKGYLGPAALLKAYRFAADSRDQAGLERLRLVANEDGVFRCHTIFNCTEDCPKGLSPTFAIQELKKRVLWKKLTFQM